MTKIKELERRIELKMQLLVLIQEEIILLSARLDDEKKAGIKWRAEELVYKRPGLLPAS